MWKYNETDNLPGDSIYHSADELYHYGVLGMKWHQRKARENAILKAKTYGKLNISSAKYNNNYKKAVRVNKMKNIVGTTAKASILTAIGADFVRTALHNKKLIKISGGTPEWNRKVRIGTAAVVGTLGAVSLYKGAKTISKGIKRQKMINQYSKQKKRKIK